MRLVEVNPHGLMSAEHGQSQQLVMQLLCDHVPALADDGKPTVVLLDEVEAVCVARSTAVALRQPGRRPPGDRRRADGPRPEHGRAPSHHHRRHLELHRRPGRSLQVTGGPVRGASGCRTGTRRCRTAGRRCGSTRSKARKRAAPAIHYCTQIARTRVRHVAGSRSKYDFRTSEGVSEGGLE